MGASASVFRKTIMSRQVPFVERNGPRQTGKTTAEREEPHSSNIQVQGVYKDGHKPPRQPWGTAFDKGSTKRIRLGKRKAVHLVNDVERIQNEKSTPKARLIAAVRAAQRRTREREQRTKEAAGQKKRRIDERYCKLSWPNNPCFPYYKPWYCGEKCECLELLEKNDVSLVHLYESAGRTRKVKTRRKRAVPIACNRRLGKRREVEELAKRLKAMRIK